MAARDLLIPAGLTPAQREAVMAPDPVLCVMAGAGTGKTRVLTLRVARRLQDGSAGRGRVLVCTFSRKAADELQDRLWVLGSGTAADAGTFHRIALRLVRQHRVDRGHAPPALVGDRRSMLAALLGGDRTEGRRVEPGRRATPRRAPDVAPSAGAGDRTSAPPRRRRDPSPAQLETEIGWAKARQVDPEGYEVAARRAGRRPAMGAARITELYGAYETAKRRRGALDLDDLLSTCAEVLEDDAPFAAAVRWRYRHVFVDEMQDVNPAQFRLLQALLGDEPDLCAVGDPHQSVYGWNGADPTLLHRLPDVLPGTRVLHLDENHRCSPQVVAVAAGALGLDPDRAPTSARSDGAIPRIVECATDVDEAAWVAREIWRAHRPGHRWGRIAVLARTNAQLDTVAGALGVARIPHRVAGRDLAPASDVVAEDDPAARGQPDEERGRRATPTVADRQGSGDGPETRETDVGPDGEVVLSTFHRAKGLQWPTVFVVGLSAGLVPIASARTAETLDEERRLLYVALTRAQDELTCTWSAHRDPWEQEAGAPARRPSPWVEDMAQVRDALAALAAPPDPSTVRAHLDEIRGSIGEGGGAEGPPVGWGAGRREPAPDGRRHG